VNASKDYINRYGLDRLLSRDLVELLRPQSRAPGELILRSGDPTGELLFFVEGKAKAYSTMENGHSVLAAFYRPFEVLGDVELFTSERYILSVEALSDTVCLCLPSADVKKAADRNSRLLEYLCGQLGRKLADRNRAESINLRYPVENRLASYLLAASDLEGVIIGTDNLGEIADFIGSSYRQLARALRCFREAGIVEDARGSIRVLDRSRLEPLARDRYDRRE
jgi:CRP/FNR family transcriptional regulator, putaive post-exponential-phase nitrogen-starvation regulator